MAYRGKKSVRKICNLNLLNMFLNFVPPLILKMSFVKHLFQYSNVVITISEAWSHAQQYIAYFSLD